MAATVSPPSAKRTSSSIIPSRASTRWCSSCARPPPIPMWWRSSRRSTAPATTAPSSQALIEAAEAGKSVTALVELKARFDEAANIKWARDLERAGVQVVYGFIELKTHAKVSLVVRRESGQLHTYVHFGTGNYHPNDGARFTPTCRCSAPIRRWGATRRSCSITSPAMPSPVRWRRSRCRRSSLRGRLIDGIQQEIMHAKAGRPAAIWVKLNSLVDPAHDRRALPRQPGGRADRTGGARHLLPAARRARACPRISGSRSIVGRFLEHGRIICFGAGHGLPSPRTPRSTFPRPTGCRAIWTAGSRRWFRSKIPPSINRSWTRSWSRC